LKIIHILVETSHFVECTKAHWDYKEIFVTKTQKLSYQDTVL